MIAIIAPAEQGLEVGGGAGTGRYSACGGTRYRETSWAGRVRYRTEEGFTAAADASGSRGTPREGPGGPQSGFEASGRLGRHGRYGGVELGVAAYRGDGGTRTTGGPSGLLWLGIPELHAFGTLMADRFAVNRGDFTVGIGHSSRWFAASAGLGVQGWAVDVELRTWRVVAPTISIRYGSDHAWNTAAGLVFHWEP